MVAQPAPQSRLGGSFKGRHSIAENATAGPSQSACQEHENEPAEVVIVCEPEGTSLMMGGLHPRFPPPHTECLAGIRRCSLSLLGSAVKHLTALIPVPSFKIPFRNQAW